MDNPAVSEVTSSQYYRVSKCHSLVKTPVTCRKIPRKPYRAHALLISAK